MINQYLYTPKVLPSVYEEAMSYYQQLKYIFEELSGTQKHLNKFIVDITTYLNDHENDYIDYTDKKIDLVQNNISEIENVLNGQIKALSDELKNIYSKLTIQIENNKDESKRDIVLLENKFNESISKLYSALFSLQNSISYDFSNLKTDLVNTIYKMASNQTGNTIIVKNPVNEKLTSLNIALESIYEFMQSYTCLTVTEYDNLNLTMDEYDERKITYLQYNSRSYLIFFHDIIYRDWNKKIEEINKKIEEINQKINEKNKVYNTITDTVTTPEVYMDSIASRTYLGITLEEYDKMIDANQFSKYNSMNISLKEYDKEMKAKYLLEIMKVNKLASGKWDIYFSYGYGSITMNMILSNVLDSMDIDLEFKNNLGILLTEWEYTIYDADNNIIDLWYKKNINNRISGSMPKEEGIKAKIILNIYFYYGGIEYERNIEN